MESEFFRQVLGTLPTGVVIVTAPGEDGSGVGLTVGSFSSVSLDPPLVSFMPAKTSGSFAALRNAGVFCANILAADQVDICRAFAAKGGDKFAGIETFAAPSGSPIIGSSIAWVDCVTESVIEAGDHFIVIGRVLDLAVHRDGVSPMVFYRGGYGQFHVPSLTAAPELDIIQPLRAADACRPAMEALAKDLSMACFAVAMVHSEMVFIASSGGPRPGDTLTRIGHRIPVFPPLGSVFIAWASASQQDAWSSEAVHAGTPLGDVVEQLELVRWRGWSITLRSEEITQLQGALRDNYEDDLTHREWSEVREPVRALTSDDYALSGIKAGTSYKVATLGAPVFDEDGHAILALSLLDLPDEIVGDRLLGIAARLAEAGRAATAAIVRLWPDSIRGWGMPDDSI